MAAASTPVSSRFKASNAAQAMNQIMRLDFDSDKEAFLEVLEDYFYGDMVRAWMVLRMTWRKWSCLSLLQYDQKVCVCNHN